jgi:hypothetical protein
MEITSGQSQPRADGKKPVCAGFSAKQNLRTQNIAGEPRQAGDFLLDEFPQREAEFNSTRHYVDRNIIHIGLFG